MRPSIIDYHPWCAKPWKDNLVDHLTSMLCICGPAWHGFDPFGDVVYGDQDILTALGFYGRSHIVDVGVFTAGLPRDAPGRILFGDKSPNSELVKVNARTQDINLDRFGPLE